MKFTINVGSNQRFEQTITIDALDVSEACRRAIEEANRSPHWRGANWCGQSFITTINEGCGQRGSDRELMPAVAVPFRFRELRAAGRADLIPLLRDAAAALSAGTDEFVSIAAFNNTLDDEAPEYVTDMEDAHADLHDAIRAEIEIAAQSDTSPDNNSRADRAEIAATFYGDKQDDLSTNIGDLLASIRHLCDRETLDFDQLSATAEIHHIAEQEAEG